MMLHAGGDRLINRLRLINRPSMSCAFCPILQPLDFNKNQTYRRMIASSSRHTNGITVAGRIVTKFPDRVQSYLRLSRLDKPTGALLALWPGLWSVGLAANSSYPPDVKTLIYTCLAFTAGGFLVRSAGCIINDMWDRDFDRQVERTRNRPLASGEIRFFPALVYLGANLSAALLVLLEFNLYTVMVGACCVPVVALYPLAKRFTHWPQLVLGLAFNWGALMGYCAVHGHNYWPVVLPLYAGCAFWSLFYDTIYAYQDANDDRRIGVKSTALRFGENPKPWLAAFSSVTLASWASAGWAANLSWPFYVAMGVTAAHMARQITALDITNPADCWQKFKSNQQIGPILMTGILFGTIF